MHTTLGDYIRAHRERVTPASAGLPGGGRRRTPGLRREELAQLCDVSPTWLTWLEQGRPVAASARLLARLADVLRLSVAERAYLFSLAGRLDPQHDLDAGTAGQGLDALVRAINAPAYILDRQWDALAWNADAAALLRGWLDGGPGAGTPNLLRFMFLQAQARDLTVDWPERARRLVAEFRADTGRHAAQEPLASLIAQLVAASEAFRQLWTLQDVVGREGGARRFRDAHGAEHTFSQVTLHPAQRPDLKLVMLLPVAQ